jgi:hypothetical protein
MKKLHVAALALLLTGGAVLGTIAVARTTGLGSAARNTNDAVILAREKQLTAYAVKLRQELKARPPALPPLPKKPSSTGPASAPKVVYQQPPPVVVTVHKHQGDDGSYEGGGGGDG